MFTFPIILVSIYIIIEFIGLFGYEIAFLINSEYEVNGISSLMKFNIPCWFNYLFISSYNYDFYRFCLVK